MVDNLDHRTQTPLSTSSFNSRFRLTTPHLPFTVEVNEWEWNKNILDWLSINIGENHKDWEWYYNDGSWFFEFTYEEDKVKFILRWL